MYANTTFFLFGMNYDFTELDFLYSLVLGQCVGKVIKLKGNYFYIYGLLMFYCFIVNIKFFL